MGDFTNLQVDNFDLLEYMSSSGIPASSPPSLDTPSYAYQFSDGDITNSNTETTDVKLPIYQMIYPKTMQGPPPRGDFPGMYDFEINLDGNTTDRKKYVFSYKLNRVYLAMMAEMPIQFKWNWEALKGHQVWVRATVILAGNEHQEARVMRCFIHKAQGDSSNRDVAENQVAHVLRSARQGEDVLYCGDEHDERQWLSVAVAMPPTPPHGVIMHQHVYMFCCKHSCVSGINRRRIEVLFTLEDSTGQVLGRKSLGVRVCSCPRRDMEKDEREYGYMNAGEPLRKKPKPSSAQGPPPRYSETTVAIPTQINNMANCNDLDQIYQSMFPLGMFLLRQLPANDPLTPSLRTFLHNLGQKMNPTVIDSAND